MANRKPMWNNYSGYQTFYPERLSYYGEDAYYEYYYQDQPTVSYNNYYPPNGYFQQNTNNKVPKGPMQNKPKESVVDKSSLYRKPAVTTPVHNTWFVEHLANLFYIKKLENIVYFFKTNTVACIIWYTEGIQCYLPLSV